MDIYQRTIKELAHDANTYIAQLPRDICGIIRQMHPQTYSIAYIADLIEDYLCIPPVTGDLERVEMQSEIGMEPNHMPVWLYKESIAPNKLDYWTNYYINSHKDTRAALCRLAKKMYGEEFWEMILENIDLEYFDE